tara:strand:+ start:362 stop:559 length:198 start_codon:yes stop_codon:yes gene_type:complete
MIRAIVFTAVGFLISKHVYEKYELNQRKIEKENTQRKLRNYLISIGWNTSEIENADLKIFGKNEQ